MRLRDRIGEAFFVVAGFALCAAMVPFVIVERPLEWLRERVRGRWAWLERMDP